MNDTTGAYLGMTGGAIAFANEWLSNNQINWRIAVATPLLGLFLYGTGKISPGLAAGLGGAMLVTVMVTPFNGKSPAQSLSSVIGKAQ